MERETEIKVRVHDADGVSRRIEALGARQVNARTLEDNRLFDLPGLPLSSSGRLLRIREFAGSWLVTAKGPDANAAGSDFKIRQEIEVHVSDGEMLSKVLEMSGFRSIWRYQKFRRDYRWGDACIVVDEIPHGVFVEIEGEPAAIEEIAGRLGFERTAWLTSTYRDIHEQHCLRAGIPCGDMLFPAGGGT